MFIALVTHRIDENFVVKVADFGLSRDLYSKDYYRISDDSCPLPIRWMAPESTLRRVFLLQSDMVGSVQCFAKI